jgi:hypothetical protein
MNERKDMGDLPTSEVVAPARTGKKAVVIMQVEVMVEVWESDDWNDMTEQAKDSLNERIREGKGFYPFYARSKTIHTATQVEDLKHKTYVEGRGQW